MPSELAVRIANAAVKWSCSDEGYVVPKEWKDSAEQKELVQLIHSELEPVRKALQDIKKNALTGGSDVVVAFDRIACRATHTLSLLGESK